ncbi:hypothetical protein O181_087940 [Austropuccinia psidii MF-1]|uniref:Reverse transcriptase Ty1/copia-type domain-containing protein n=1 Tax=Austropuccinia psidii MF-1 TaxID=1389203 RepID=A0A9Q3P2W9_9BASI|nr:hypothetical protein [Austropuccinia psidii MF-1]
MNSLKNLIAFAASRGLLFHQVDFKSAFLNAPLTETVYLSIPQGLNLDQRKSCLRLKKSIYGLKQTPLAWYDRLKKWLFKVGFTPYLLDPCVFFRQNPVQLWLYIHVDNIAIFGLEVKYFKEEISKEFEIKKIGTTDLILGVKISHSDNFIFLDQQNFTKALLELYGMEKCKPVVTPLPPQTHLVPALEEDLSKFNAFNVSY